MKYLAFARTPILSGGRRIRSARFESRSLLPVSAACVVAGGVRETLSAHFGSSLPMRLHEPTLPSPEAWREIARDASIYRVRGSMADAAIIVRSSDAAALVAAAFGECRNEIRALSAIERTVLDRVVGSVASNFAAVCGAHERLPDPEPINELTGFVTYFELLVGCEPEFRIGIALSRDPKTEPTGCLTIEDLLEVEIELNVCTAGWAMRAEALLDLEIGAFVPMIKTTVPVAGTVRIAGWPLAHGECGVSGGRYAIGLDERAPA